MNKTDWIFVVYIFNVNLVDNKMYKLGHFKCVIFIMKEKNKETKN